MGQKPVILGKCSERPKRSNLSLSILTTVNGNLPPKKYLNFVLTQTHIRHIHIHTISNIPTSIFCRSQPSGSACIHQKLQNLFDFGVYEACWLKIKPTITLFTHQGLRILSKKALDNTLSRKIPCNEACWILALKTFTFCKIRPWTLTSRHRKFAAKFWALKIKCFSVFLFDSCWMPFRRWNMLLAEDFVSTAFLHQGNDENICSQRITQGNGITCQVLIMSSTWKESSQSHLWPKTASKVTFCHRSGPDWA